MHFAGTPQGVEARLVKLAGIPFAAFDAAGFDRQAPWTLVTSSIKIARSAKRARSWMSELDPARPTAVICAAGVRSAKAIQALTTAGYVGELVNVTGGMKAWLSQ